MPANSPRIAGTIRGNREGYEMRIRVKHESIYRYGEPAALGPHMVRLRPTGHTRATVLSYNLDVAPACAVRWH